jgi:hypothetical protein
MVGTWFVKKDKNRFLKHLVCTKTSSSREGYMEQYARAPRPVTKSYYGASDLSKNLILNVHFFLAHPLTPLQIGAASIPSRSRSN